MSTVNWKNVNNWHWTGKNCIAWAKTYLQGQLSELEARDGHLTVRTEGTVDISGDVELNQRKGKVITIFDVDISVLWTGEIADGEAVELKKDDSRITARGRVDIKEFMFDSVVEDLECEVSCQAETSEKRPLIELVKRELVWQIKKVLNGFAVALVEENTKDVIINTSDFQARVKDAPTPAHVTQSTITTNSKPLKVETTRLTYSVDFTMTAHELYEALLDIKRVQSWTRRESGLVLERRVGGKVVLWDGKITGEFVNLIPEKKIVQRWRMHTWPPNHYSTVHLTLEPGQHWVTVHVLQEGIPIAEAEKMRWHWYAYYWEQIWRKFGSPAFKPGTLQLRPSKLLHFGSGCVQLGFAGRP
ncbi:uncharacterized protein VTP21DRAFT_3920 [Calcarisporiella thermophila]|uniref:uncharacterized protein n=1 Tax=Calcarisporiella thermophila TaxID=911321 RepID=UPI0037428E17